MTQPLEHPDRLLEYDRHLTVHWGRTYPRLGHTETECLPAWLVGGVAGHDPVSAVDGLDRIGKRPDGVDGGRQGEDTVDGDAAMGHLEPEATAQRGRHPHRATGVCADGDRGDACGHGRGRSTR